MLGFDDLAGYATERRFFGATVGRYANRIANARFVLDGEEVRLAANNGPHALHGGPNGFDRKLWQVTETGDGDQPYVTLAYVSADGEEGYPGRLDVNVTYQLTGPTELSLVFTAGTDHPTIVNLTNHSFFNLEGAVSGSDKVRAREQSHGIDVEPYAFFIGKSAVFAGVVLYFTYLIASHRGLPNVLVVMTALIALYGFVTRRTVIGRQIYAVGGNAKAAKLSGIKTERLTFLTFVNMGVLAALAGLVFAARLNTATPKAGAGFELDVIAACFIGGASAYGGVGRVGGAVIGAMIMGVMNNGMSILGVGIDYQQVIKGLVLLGAVCLDVYNQRR